MSGALRLFGVAAVMALAACSGPTGTGVTDARVAGTWQYHAATASSGMVVDAVLVLRVASSGAISGTVEGTEADAAGHRATVQGLVSGSVTGTGAADFTVTLVGGRSRDHVAALRGDSLTGDWIERQVQGAASTGRFGARRSAP